MDKVAENFSHSPLSLVCSCELAVCSASKKKKNSDRARLLNNEKLTIFYSGYFYDSIGERRERRARVESTNKQHHLSKNSGIIVDSLSFHTRSRSAHSRQVRLSVGIEVVCVHKFPPKKKKRTWTSSRTPHQACASTFIAL